MGLLSSPIMLGWGVIELALCWIIGSKHTHTIQTDDRESIKFVRWVIPIIAGNKGSVFCSCDGSHTTSASKEANDHCTPMVYMYTCTCTCALPDTVSSCTGTLCM